MNREIKLGNKKIGAEQKTFVIAEAGSNHGGDLNQAKELIDVAVEAGADAVKFQSYEGDSLVLKSNSAYDILDKYSLPKQWHFELNKYCNKKEIIFCSSVFDSKRLSWLEEANVPFHKVASGDLNYYPFIKKIAKTDKPIILSTGMATLGEVEEAVETILKTGNDKIILLHCVGQYPTKEKEVNLSVLNTLRQSFGFPVGFSDHTESSIIPGFAVSMGADIIEKHFTLDKKLETPDHSFALKPKELNEMIDNIRRAETIKGSRRKRPTSSEEESSRVEARRSIHTKELIEKGEVFTEEKMKVVRPAEGLPPKYLKKIIGKKATKNLEAEVPIGLDCIQW